MESARSSPAYDGASQSRSRRLTDLVRSQHGSGRDISLSPEQSTPGSRARLISEQRDGSPDEMQALPQVTGREANEVTTNKEPADLRAQIELMEPPELAQYLEEVGCEIGTIQTIVTAKLNGLRYLAVLDHADADDILENDLAVKSRITRITMISDVKSKGPIAKSSEMNPRDQSHELHRIKWSPVPKMPLTKAGEPILSGKQWKNYGISLVGWCDMYDEEFSELVSLCFKMPEADYEDVASLFTPIQAYMDKMIFKELSCMRFITCVRMEAFGAKKRTIVERARADNSLHDRHMYQMMEVCTISQRFVPHVGGRRMYLIILLSPENN